MRDLMSAQTKVPEYKIGVARCVLNVFEASKAATMVPKAGSRIVPVTKARRFGASSARRWPVCWPGGARSRGGVSWSQALIRNRRTSRPDAVRQSKWVLSAPGRERENAKGRQP